MVNSNDGDETVSPLPSTPTPATPTDKPRSRFDQYYYEDSPSQSPMIKITEEDHSPSESPSYSDLFPPSSAQTNKRYSAHFSTPMLYSLENNSSSSLLIPGGNVAGNRSSVTSLKYAPPTAPFRNKSPTRNRSPTREGSPSRYRSPSPKKPFNFKSTNMSAPMSMNNTRASHRKGHRYKHSSVSMNLFQEPKLRAPLKIPVSHPIPTLREFLGSCTKEQKGKLVWSSFHLLLSSLILLCGFSFGLHSLSTLSHLVFYDAVGCMAVVFANIMNNFDVYTQSSIKFPFGLGRIKVLFEFALSVSLVFVGCDLISHLVEEIIIGLFNTDDHQHPESGHNHHASTANSSSNFSLTAYEICMAVTLLTTVISSRISNPSGNSSSQLGNFRHTILSNPTHFITLIFTCYLAVHPILLSLDSDIGFNEVSSFLISFLIIFMGWKVVKKLGFVVLLSSPGLVKNNNISSEIQQQIMDLNAFKSSYLVRNLVISQVHLNLMVVLVSIKMVGGTDDEELSLRIKIDETVKQALNSKDKTIETTIDIDRL